MTQRILTLGRSEDFQGDDQSVKNVQAFYDEHMKKSLDCATDIMTRLGTTAREQIEGDRIDIDLTPEYVQVSIVKAGLQYDEVGIDKLCDVLFQDITTDGLSTCAVWEMAHTIHHYALEATYRMAN